MVKGFIRRVLFVIIFIGTIVFLSGCGEDVNNSTINKAIAESAIVERINSEYVSQMHLLRDLLDLGVLSQMDFSILTSTLRDAQSAFCTSLGLGVDVVYEVDEELLDEDGNVKKDADGNTMTVKRTVLQEDKGMHPTVAKILQAVGWMEVYPTEVTTEAGTHVPDADNEDDRQAIIDVFGATYFPAYDGFDTRKLIEKTSYKNALGTSIMAGGAARGSKVIEGKETYGVSDENALLLWKDAASLQPICDAYNRLGALTVRSIKAGTLTGDDYSKIQAALAVEDVDTLDKWYTTLVCSGFVPVGWEPINSPEELLEYKILDVKEGTRLVARIRVRTLNIDRIKELLQSNTAAAYSNGVVISVKDGAAHTNTLYITKYDVAVLQGFREVGNNSGNYAPIFTYQPDTKVNKTWAQYIFQDWGIPLAEIKETFNVKEEYINSTSLVVDFMTGTLMKKDARTGRSTEFMSLSAPACVTVVNSTDFKRLKNTAYISPSYDTNVEAVKTEAKFDTHPYDQPLFVLTEYLELLYSPDIIAGEPLVAYGRKVRLDDSLYAADLLTYSSTVVAVGGKNLELTSMLSVSSFYDTLKTAKPVVLDPSSKADTVAAVHLMGNEKGGTYHTGDVTAGRGDRLPQITAKKGIDCVIRFGSDYIAKEDNVISDTASTQTPLYGIILYQGIYDAFTDWINVPGNANLAAWSVYLKDLGYPNYNIGNESLTNFMKGNYTFELNQDGLLSLDLNTIIDINAQKTENRRSTGVMVLRTVLMVLGFVLIAYVNVLLGAWAVDVNLDLGLNLLEKVSLGHFVAVRSKEEMPPPDAASATTYVDFGGVVLRSIAFAVIGVLLITIDPVGLVIKLLTGLQFILNEISRIIFGSKPF